MSTVTSESTIKRLREMFSRYGVLQRMVSNNGPQFTSRAFAEFMKKNGVKYTLISSYHPRSNSQAERFVQKFEQYFKEDGSKSINKILPRFLFSYRTTPNSAKGETPAELFMNGRLRTRSVLIHQDLKRKVIHKKMEKKTRHDRTSKQRQFALGQQVLVENFRGKSRWLDAIVMEQTGPVSYKVLIGDQLRKHHLDQMREKC